MGAPRLRAALWAQAAAALALAANAAAGDRCSVTEFGAKGDGSVETAAVNAAIAAARCDEVVFPRPLTVVTGTVVLRSNLVVTVEPGATLAAAPKGGHHFLSPPHNPWDGYQDYGHSHWADALVHGSGVDNVTLRGGGMIDGRGQLHTGTPPLEDACKMFGVVSSTNVAIENLRLSGGGWFTALLTNVTGLRVEGVTVDAQRDGLDVVACRDVLVNDVTIEGGGDDAMVLKSDYSLGAALTSTNITVANSRFGCGCNGLNFGSETAGNFSGVLWENITVTKAGKAGIGIVTMDGAHISDVTYRNVSIIGAYTPFYLFVGDRLRRPDNATVTPGTVTDVLVDSVTVRGGGFGTKGNVTATANGLPANASLPSFPVGPRIAFANVELRVPGGGTAADGGRDPPQPDPSKYQPRYLGVRPAFGWFLRRAVGLTLTNVTLGFDGPDARPAIVLDGGSEVTLDGVCAARGVGTRYDVVLRNASTATVVRQGAGCPPLRVQPPGA